MPPVVIVSCLLVAAALGALGWALTSAVQPVRARSLANLERGIGPAVAVADPAASSTLTQLARRLTPKPFRDFLAKQHARAGRPKDWPLDRLLLIKMCVVPVVALLAFAVAASGSSPMLVLLMVVAGVVLYFLPDLLLLSKGQERDQKIEIELADTLDQMTIAVEAGLAFDSAMARAAANGKGVLAEELTRTLQDMRMGQSRRQAFADLAARSQVHDLKQFVRAIMQADANGISVGDVLRTQADEMRLKRRQRAEMKAQQVPVKVLMPLILCIMPVLFIVVIGPAAMSAIAAFSSTG